VLGLRKQDIAINKNGFLAVGIENPPASLPTYILALGSEKRVLGTEKVRGANLAGFVLPLKTPYDIVAFADRNGNGRLDANESAGVARDLTSTPLADPAAARQLYTIRLQKPAPADFVGLTVSTVSGDALPMAVGEVAKTSEARFAPKIGEDGLWKPETSLRAGNLGLYFTEPYDPSRIPVIFVHGIGGSPQDFAKLIPALDRSRYQAWFFTYPSGFRLEKAASALAAMTKIAAKAHGVTRVHIVAHSMGGLVSRSAILKFQGGDVVVDRFISISTPWNGHQAAAWGVRGLRYPVPSWIDMAPGSDFLKRLWSQKLPSPTRHWLLFGYDTRRLPWLTLNNDQVINVNSSLYVPAQDESVRVFGMERSHEGILASPQTAVRMNQFLSE